MTGSPQTLNDTDVVSLRYDDEGIVLDAKTYRAEEFLKKLAVFFDQNFKTSLQYCTNWCTTGILCEALTPGNPWRKGKVRLRLEFIPDEPEPQAILEAHSEQESASPLDDIRQSIQ